MTVYFHEKGNEALFRKVKAEMAGPRGGYGGPEDVQMGEKDEHLGVGPLSGPAAH